VTGPIVAKLRRRVVSATDRLKYLAYRDPLTGLENERAFRESLERILSETVVRDDILAVLHLEVDNVKAVSDVRGQHVGKELLNAIARRLSEVVEAKHGQIFRTGNNEFAIITTALESRHQVRDLSRKILAKFSRSIALSQDDVVVTVSIGSSVFPDDGSRADAISANADIAMSVARRSGRHLFREYKPEMGLATRQRLNLETDLRKALARAQLEVYYQPQIDSLTQRVIGAEALLRWRHPQHGMIAPLDFIPIAEETGLIIEIGKWVLQEACREALHWERNGFGALRMSVNVSARQIGSPSFTQDIFDILKQNNFPPDRLELELTESELMHDIDAGIAFMQAVRARGVGISLDDFGTGYSSLSYLSSFPLDRLKIDRSFVKDLPAQGCAMAKAVISLARSFDLEIVAEGVEEFEQFAWLKEMGCGIIQGFLFARPMDASTVRRFLSGHAASR
jgi:diguanylate cyclase (GGDEF)-like protein